MYDHRYPCIAGNCIDFIKRQSPAFETATGDEWHANKRLGLGRAAGGRRVTRFGASAVTPVFRLNFHHTCPAIATWKSRPEMAQDDAMEIDSVPAPVVHNVKDGESKARATRRLPLLLTCDNTQTSSTSLTPSSLLFNSSTSASSSEHFAGSALSARASPRTARAWRRYTLSRSSAHRRALSTARSPM